MAHAFRAHDSLVGDNLSFPVSQFATNRLWIYRNIEFD